MTVYLTEDQKNEIQNKLETSIVMQAHTSAWSRRLYAPMLIHTPQFSNVKQSIERMFPNYATTFDVIFESNGNSTPWHCDYESLGPFIVSHRLRAIRENHFISIHFNLTSDGGALKTMPWSLLSFVHYMIIVKFGIFSRMHKLAVWMSSPLFFLCSTRYKNTCLEGNAFNNLKLHSVTSGLPRVSYVVRLVRKHDRVKISRESVMEGIQRSEACWAFKQLYYKVSEVPQDASKIAWNNMESYGLDEA